MKEVIRNAYEHITPDDDTRDVLLQRIQSQSHIRETTVCHPWKRYLTTAACIVLVAVLSGLGIAAYQKWSLPEPITYTVDPDNGIYRVKESQTYAVSTTVTSITSASVPSMPDKETTASSQITTITDKETTVSSQTATITDEEFIQKAMEILQSVDLENINQEQASVVHQDNLYWGRGEVEVYFEENESITCVKFQEDTGALLSMSSPDWIADGTPCNSTEETEALAIRYYEMLPVTQGYVLTGCDQYDHQYWSFSFCREVMENVYSWYEAVKINVNPQNGRLVGCSVFSVPLLDDHGADDIPLTAEEAEEIARDCRPNRLEHYELQSCELEVVLPNWWYTDRMADSLNAQICDVTRLGWVLTFNNPDSDFADKVILYVDYYTGEILGGDAV